MENVNRFRQKLPSADKFLIYAHGSGELNCTFITLYRNCNLDVHIVLGFLKNVQYIHLYFVDNTIYSQMSINWIGKRTDFPAFNIHQKTDKT